MHCTPPLAYLCEPHWVKLTFFVVKIVAIDLAPSYPKNQQQVVRVDFLTTTSGNKVNVYIAAGKTFYKDFAQEEPKYKIGSIVGLKDVKFEPKLGKHALIYDSDSLIVQLTSTQSMG